MALQFQGHRHLDDVIARLEKRYGKAGGKTPQPSEAHFKKNQPPKRKLNLKILQPAKRQVSFQPPSVLDTGELPATVTTRRKPKRAAPAKPKLSVKEDRKRRMKKRHWYEDKFGDLSKFVKKKPQKRRSAPPKRPKRAAAKRAMTKIKRGKAWYARKFQVGKFAKTQRAPAKSRAKKKPICFNRKVTLLGLLKRIPAVKTPLAKLFG